jgi:hypothetical protein
MFLNASLIESPFGMEQIEENIPQGTDGKHDRTIGSPNNTHITYIHHRHIQYSLDAEAHGISVARVRSKSVTKVPIRWTSCRYLVRAD